MAAIVAVAPMSARVGAGQGDGADFSIADALAEFPVADAERDWFQVSAADLDAASEAAGLARPQLTSTPDDIAGWAGPLTGLSLGGNPVAPVFVPFAETFNPAELQNIDEFASELGWSLFDVGQFVELSAPPSHFMVVTGDFDETTLSPRLVETEPGIFTAGKGEDFSIHPAGRTPARPLGRPLHMSISGDRMAVSSSTPMTQAWISGTGPTLADDESLAIVAAALDDADVVSAFLVRAPFELDDMHLPPEAVEQIAESVVLAPFNTVGIGWAAEDGQPVVTIAYAFQTDEAAAAMVDPLTSLYAEGTSLVTSTPFSDRWSLDGVIANVRVVSVRLLPVDNASASLPFKLLYQRDLPFVHR